MPDDFDPWNRPDWTAQPTLAAYRAAWDRLDAPHRATLLGEDVDHGLAYDDAVTELFDLTADEMMRRPVDLRAAKRAAKVRKYRAAKRLVRAQRRAAIAERLVTPAPSVSIQRKAARMSAYLVEKFGQQEAA